MAASMIALTMLQLISTPAFAEDNVDIAQVCIIDASAGVHLVYADGLDILAASLSEGDTTERKAGNEAASTTDFMEEDDTTERKAGNEAASTTDLFVPFEGLFAVQISPEVDVSFDVPEACGEAEGIYATETEGVEVLFLDGTAATFFADGSQDWYTFEEEDYTTVGVSMYDHYVYGSVYDEEVAYVVLADVD